MAKRELPPILATHPSLNQYRAGLQGVDLENGLSRTQ